MIDLAIRIDAPTATDVRALLETHLAWSRDVTPAGHVHALDVDALAGPSITFFSARTHGRLLGVGALREIDAHHGELKSMHTTAPARGRGIGHAMVTHLLDVARARGYTKVSLETGTMAAFAPARSLYAALGFRRCPPFGDYTANPHSICMTIDLPPS